MKSFVLILANLTSCTTVKLLLVALRVKALLNANLLTLRFNLNVWDLGVGPNAIPPPLYWTALLEPCLALPVPFCLNGFLPPPDTSALVLTLWVPCLNEDCCLNTASKIACVFTSIPNTPSANSISPTLLALKSNTSNLALD